MKKLFGVKTVIASALGGALFLTLFALVKVPSPVPNTNIQFAYAISSFFGVLFGPICSALIAFAGHALNDFLVYGSCWWSWIIASGVVGIIQGVPYFKSKVEEGEAPKLSFYLFNILAHAVGWLVVAPVLDVVMFGEDFKLVFLQGVAAFIINTISTLIVSGVLTTVYALTRTKKGSLDQE